MKSLEEYMNEAFKEYDEKKHIIGWDFARLSNMRDGGILNDIEKYCPTLISPQEDEFGRQKLSILFDKNELVFTMPNNIGDDGPMELTFRYRVKGDIVKDYISKDKDFSGNDLKLITMPKYFTRIATTISDKYLHEIPILLALVLNRQSEPLW